MKSYMSYRNVSSLEELLEIDKTTKLIQSSIIEYLVYLKQVRKTSYSYRNVQLAAIKHFYRMNDFEELNWFRIGKYLGEHTKVVKDRAYTTEEIQQILLKSDERMRVVILLLASTGMRIGAIPFLKIRSLVKIPEYNLYQITVYENTEEEYFTFCTPECAAAIDSYLAYRERYGEKLQPTSPLIREMFNIFEPDKIRSPRPLSEKTIGTFLQNLLARAGIVTVTPRIEGSDMRGRDRHQIQRATGFRKFCTSNMIRAKVNPEAREMLIGHSIGLSDSYYRPTPNELLEQYFLALDMLTISNENRLKKKVQMLTIRSDKIDDIQKDMEAITQKLTASVESNKREMDKLRPTLEKLGIKLEKPTC